MSAPKIVIAAGGTAGHVVPALAIADALRAEGAEVVFAGGERAEAELVPAAGYRLETLKVEGISRTNPLRAARAVAKAAGATGVAARLLRREGAQAVLGGGGYVAGTVGLAAVLTRVPLVLTEADSHLGLSNRLLTPFASRVCLAFPKEGRRSGRFLVTGRPVGPAEHGREAARTEFGVEPGERCVLVFGGSLGARSINFAAVEAFADAPYRVLHVSGRRDFAELTAPGEHYVLRDYVVPFGKALVAADLAVARAGGSIFELFQYGLPSVLVPYPHATGDHQRTNARFAAGHGAAVIVPDAELNAPRLRAEVDALLGDERRLRVMSQAAAALARPDAAEAIAREVLAAARRR